MRNSSGWGTEAFPLSIVICAPVVYEVPLRKTIAGRVDKNDKNSRISNSDWFKFRAFRYPTCYLILERYSHFNLMQLKNLIEFKRKDDDKMSNKTTLT